MVKPGFEWFERPDGTKNVKLAEGIRILTKKQEGKVLWKNMFKLDWQLTIFTILVLILIFSYQQSTKQCMDVVENPCKYVKNLKCNDALYQATLNLSENFNYTNMSLVTTEN